MSRDSAEDIWSISNRGYSDADCGARQCYAVVVHTEWSALYFYAILKLVKELWDVRLHNIFYNHHIVSGAYSPASTNLFGVDAQWMHGVDNAHDGARIGVHKIAAISLSDRMQNARLIQVWQM